MEDISQIDTAAHNAIAAVIANIGDDDQEGGDACMDLDVFNSIMQEDIGCLQDSLNVLPNAIMKAHDMTLPSQSFNELGPDECVIDKGLDRCSFHVHSTNMMSQRAVIEDPAFSNDILSEQPLSSQLSEDDFEDDSSSVSPCSSGSTEVHEQDIEECPENIKLSCSSEKENLVDLTVESDSDYDNDNVGCHINANGKRLLPRPENESRSFKDIPLQPLLSKKVYNVGSSPKVYNADRCMEVFARPGTDHYYMQFSPAMNVVRQFPLHVKFDPHLANLTERVPLPALYTAMASANGRDCNPNMFQEYARRLAGHAKEDPLKGLSKVFDGSSLTEEACLEEGLMTVSLLKHQRIALAWMEKREKGTVCAGGILADDQGLGKTVSTIALVLKVKPPLPAASDGGNRLDCEPSMVDLDDNENVQIHHADWLDQLEQNVPSGNGHQSQAASVSRGRLSAGTLVVCPTSVLRQWAQEIKEKVVGASVLLYHGSNRTKDPSEFAKYDIVLTTYSIVSLEVPKQPLAEGKEADERNPVQYGLTELTSQQYTINKAAKTKKSGLIESKKQVGPLASVVWFRVVLDEAQNIKNHKTQAARACWGLRAKRRWCLSGTPIQNTIEDLYSYFRFLKYEPFSLYRFFRSEVKDLINRDPVLGYKKLQSILQKVLLRRTKESVINGEPIITLPKKMVKLEQVEFSPQEREFYNTLEVESRKQFQMYAAAGTVQRNYVNILWMLLRLRQACNHPRLVKNQHSDALQMSTRESASRLSHEKRESLLLILESSGDPCHICNDVPDNAVITTCGHVFCGQCLCDRLTHDDSATCPYPKCHGRVNSDSMYSLLALKYPDGKSGAHTEAKMATNSCDSSSGDSSEASSKIKAVIGTLRALPPLINSKDSNEDSNSEDARTEKAIVFSQWTSMLDLLEVSLKKERFCYRRLDGTMSIQARDRALSDFKLNPKVTVIIMSLKAASLGLNMVTGSHVLLIDVWWNPTTEDQAVDRAHRIGQTRVVHVSRFTIKNTIEDRILELQERKRQMVASAFGEETATKQKTQLSVEEMSYLFRA